MIVKAIFKFVFNVVFFLIGFVFELLFNLIESLGINLPDITSYTSVLRNFWDLVFSAFGYIRSIFLIDTFELEIIIIVLTLKLLHKPIVSVAKMVIKYFHLFKP